jgi:hypothetical protein
MLLQFCLEMFGVCEAYGFDSEVVDDKAEGDGSPYVPP